MSRFIPLETHPTQTQAEAAEWADSTRSSAQILPEGARLRDYEVAGCIGEGGFGIVYLAWDPAMAEHVAVKEFLPATLASRAHASPSVVIKSQRHVDSFRRGMRSFINEARTLSQFDHPALVKVLNFWEANGTVYMAMPYYVGPTLAEALAERGHAPDEATLREWLHPLLDVLEMLHAANCFHRDIAPDNILITDDGPVLLDFGAARRVIDSEASSPTVVFKPGFTPIEQHSQVATMKQGAWTDLYALAGVVYSAITGNSPAPSIDRLMDDRLRPLSELARGRYSKAFLATIDAALALHPRDRPQSVAEFRERLGHEIVREPPPPPIGSIAPTAPITPTAPTAAAVAVATPQRPVAAASQRVPMLWIAVAVAFGLFVAAGYQRFGGRTAPSPSPQAASRIATPLEPPPAPATSASVPESVPPPAAEPAAPEPAQQVAQQPAPPAVAPELAAPEPPVPSRPLATLEEKPVRAVEPIGPIEPAPRVAAVRPTRREVRRPVLEASAAPPLKGRCAELLQRASLEPLSRGEVGFLTKECAR